MPGKGQATSNDDALGVLCPASRSKNVDQWTIEDEGEVSGVVTAQFILGVVNPAG